MDVAEASNEGAVLTKVDFVEGTPIEDATVVKTEATQ